MVRVSYSVEVRHTIRIADREALLKNAYELLLEMVRSDGKGPLSLDAGTCLRNLSQAAQSTRHTTDL